MFCLGFRVSGLRSRFRIYGLGCFCLGFMVFVFRGSGFGFRVFCLGYRVYDLGLKGFLKLYERS